MVFAMTGQITSTLVQSKVIEPEYPAGGRGNDTDVKIDQVGIVGAVSLGVADPVRIMAGIAGC